MVGGGWGRGCVPKRISKRNYSDNDGDDAPSNYVEVKLGPEKGRVLPKITQAASCRMKQSGRIAALSSGDGNSRQRRPVPSVDYSSREGQGGTPSHPPPRTPTGSCSSACRGIRWRQQTGSPCYWSLHHSHHLFWTGHKMGRQRNRLLAGRLLVRQSRCAKSSQLAGHRAGTSP